MIKWVLIGVFLGSVSMVHFRGRVRHHWLGQLFDHSALLAPINVCMYLFSGVSTRPFVPTDSFPGLRDLEAHWPVIRDEARALIETRRIKAAENNDDIGFNSFFKEGWKRFYLKWYEVRPPSAERYCPRTVELLQRVPSIKAALYAELPPHSKLNPHRDPYAGSMRYHLGLDTPNDDRCCIWVDGESFSWRDGLGMVFDETYVHWVRNDTDKTRLILLCDIERPLRFRWAAALNRGFSRHVMSAAAAPNEVGDPSGMIGKLIRVATFLGTHRRRFKRWSRTTYQITRVALIAGLVGLVWWW